jgi:Oxidoreductase molybdopterin binding domain
MLSAIKISSSRKTDILKRKNMEDTQKHYTGGEIAKTRQSSSMGLIIRQKEPPNLETPLDQLDSFLTPMELFYIRNHFPAPKLDLASYQLRIDGSVGSPFSLSYQELREMPSETRVAILESAGNNRVFLVPKVEGAQWEARRGRQCGMDRCASGRFAGARRHGRKRL